MDAVELEQFAVTLADLFFDVAIPQVSSEAEGAVRLLVQGNVIRPFELVAAMSLSRGFTAGEPLLRVQPLQLQEAVPSAHCRVW